jgi:sulfoxide reductase heme-binding subunit YedZ
MTAGDPTHLLFWFASRAFGMVAIAMLGISVALGLAMSGRLVRRPGLPAKLKRWHEASVLVTLGLIVVHGGLLLFDSYLRPGLAGVTLPLALSYRPVFTGIGIIRVGSRRSSASASTRASGSASRCGGASTGS